MYQEGLSFGRANAGDGIKHRGHALLAAPGPVCSNGKAVRLVTDSLH
jgi:hypothetical protein